jgi:opacity protein-like surface antigen
MRKLLLALALLGAKACPCTCLGEGEFYIGGFAGANFLQNITYHEIKTKFKAGFAGGVSLGYAFQNNFRLEGEFAYRRNVLKHLLIHNENVKFDRLRVSFETYAAMANLFYDIDLCLNWMPYVGFGLGYGWNKAQVSDHVFHFSDASDGFAFQGILGAAYRFCRDIYMGLEYRYFQARSDVKSHAAVLSVRYGF